jgi:hypothetical protein
MLNEPGESQVSQLSLSQKRRTQKLRSLHRILSLILPSPEEPADQVNGANYPANPGTAVPVSLICRLPPPL